MTQTPDSPEMVSAMLAAIVASSDDAIVGTTLEGVITSWNASAERIFGYSAGEAIGQPIALVIPPERRAEDTEALSRIRNGEKIDHFETVRRARDGRLLDVSLTVSPIRDSTGRIVGVSKVSRDISDRKRLEQLRAELLERIQSENRTNDDFLAMLGHELRNPLAAIASAGHVLAIARHLDDVARPRIIIERQVAHLARLVADLLDAARVRMGKIALNRQSVGLAEAVEHVLEALGAGTLPARHLIEVDIEDVKADADPARLEQMIQNLMTNALKYTPEGRCIRITGRCEGRFAVLRIEDEGVGIAPSALPRIFGLFEQGDSTIERADGGLGIGLALVRTLAELHGGSVEARSEGVGCGSEFTIRLPLAHAGTRRDPAPGAVTSVIGRRILIVEDNDDAREMLRLLLERQGHEVFEASDGAEGVRLALDLRPHLALIDIGLPVLDGYEVARLIRQSRRGGRLVALSGYGQPEDRERSLAAGFDDHLVKPILPTKLFDVLQKVN